MNRSWENSLSHISYIRRFISWEFKAMEPVFISGFALASRKQAPASQVQADIGKSHRDHPTSEVV